MKVMTNLQRLDVCCWWKYEGQYDAWMLEFLTSIHSLWYLRFLVGSNSQKMNDTLSVTKIQIFDYQKYQKYSASMESHKSLLWNRANVSK